MNLTIPCLREYLSRHEGRGRDGGEGDQDEEGDHDGEVVVGRFHQPIGRVL